MIINRRRRFMKRCVIVTIDRDDRLHPTATPNSKPFKFSSSGRRTSSRSFIKFIVCSQSNRVPFVSLCSQLISASIGCLISNFDRKNWKKSSLELHFCLQKIQNEKPCIRRLIGSFRRLIWVRLFVFILIFHHLVLILRLAL